MKVIGPSLPELHPACVRYQITAEDLEHIRMIGRWILPEIDWVMSEFYHWMAQQNFYKQFFFDDDLVNHIKESQKEYWIAFFKAEVTDEYIAKRKRLGEVHAQIGLSLNLYTEANAVFQELFKQILEQENVKNHAYIWSLMKYMNWDYSIVSSAEARANTLMLERMLTEQARALEKMSTPISVLWDGILLLPVVGQLSKKRSERMTIEILDAIKKYEAKVLIMDLKALTEMNKTTANYFLKIARAIRLMGCQCSLTGISPKIAEILMESDVDTTKLDTDTSLVNSLEKALNQNGRMIIEI